MIEYMVSGSRNSPPFRLALEMNRCLRGTQVPERKDYIDPKGSKQRNCPKQLQTHKLHTDGVEILRVQIREEIYDSLTSHKFFPEEEKWCRKGSGGTLHRSTHLEWEQDQTEKFSCGLDWLRKGIWHGPAKLDNKLPQNVQIIRWSHKFYRENHENLEIGVDSRRKKLSWSKNPKSYFSRRCTITVTNHNCHDATYPHTQKMHSRIII